MNTYDKPIMRQRDYYLDNLKVFLTFLVIFFHSIAGFGDPNNSWPYHPSLNEFAGPWVGNFMSFCFSFFMALYFMISGYFVPYSYDHHGAKMFAYKKMLRLFVPMVFITVVLSVMTHNLEVGHAWFLQHLLLFSLVYALIRLFTSKTISQSIKQLSLWTLLLVFLGLSFVNHFVKTSFYADQWFMLLGFLRTEPYHYPQHLLMFIIGVVAYRKNWFKLMSAKVGLTTLIIGAVLSIMIFVRDYFPFLKEFIGNNWNWYEGLMCITLCFGLTYLFKEVFNKGNKFMSWLSAHSFGAYVFHLMILLGLEFCLDSVYIGPLKFVVVWILTSVLSFTITWVVRLIPCVRKVL